MNDDMMVNGDTESGKDAKIEATFCKFGRNHAIGNFFVLPGTKLIFFGYQPKTLNKLIKLKSDFPQKIIKIGTIFFLIINVYYLHFNILIYK